MLFPLLGERSDFVANCVIRDCRDVACGGPSVFWKKLSRLLFRLTDPLGLELKGTFDGVEVFLELETGML